jgi:hypothetical protein
MPQRPRLASVARFAPAILVLFLCMPVIAIAGDAPKGAAKSQSGPGKTGAPAHAAAGQAKAAGAAAIDLPHYTEPPAYAVDLVIHSQGKDMVLKRFIDQGQIRTEIAASGQDIVMIETGDEKGTSYTLMPKQKRAMKQSRAAMEATMEGSKMKKAIKEPEAVGEAAPPDLKLEDLGDETLGGRAVKKLRISVPEGTSLGWFDKATGAPVRMEGTVDGQTASIEWQNYKVGPQPKALYEVPKGYELTDMDEMMGKMKGMGGMGGMMGGAGGMMGGMGQNMGQSLGGSLGATLGGSLGGPLGAAAGQYLGGKVGGMIGRKAVEAVTPGE